MLIHDYTRSLPAPGSTRAAEGMRCGNRNRFDALSFLPFSSVLHTHSFWPIASFSSVICVWCWPPLHRESGWTYCWYWKWPFLIFFFFTKNKINYYTNVMTATADSFLQRQSEVCPRDSLVMLCSSSLFELFYLKNSTVASLLLLWLPLPFWCSVGILYRTSLCLPNIAKVFWGRNDLNNPSTLLLLFFVLLLLK